jgi:PAS domain S-box-containing protein
VARRKHSGKASSHRGGESLPASKSDEVERLLADLRIHQAELETQNEELLATRRELEALLTEYTNLYDFAPVGYLTLDQTGLVRKANLAAATLMGTDRSRLAARPFVHFLPPAMRPSFEAFLRQARETGAKGSHETLVVRNGDRPLWVHIEAGPSASGGESRLALLDIDERKRLQKALEEIHRELEERVRQRTVELEKAHEQLRAEVAEREKAESYLRQAQKLEALGTLAGGIAHDFNNILAAMIGFAELMKDRMPEGSRQREHAGKIVRAGVRGRDLVRQMLTFSRQAEQTRKPLRLATIVKESAKLLRSSTPSTIDMKVHVKGDGSVIMGDPVQIEQVLMNLVTNAIHAMRDGGVLEIGLSHCDTAPSSDLEPGPYVKLTVRDTGTGIAPEIVDRIFDPFFTTKGLGEGTGLGLSVVLGIVKQSRGHIAVASAPGKGTTFDVYFPAIVDEPTKSDRAGDLPVAGGHERLLFIDDEPALTEIGEELLTGLGYEVTIQTSGRAALALFRLDPSRFDLVITDQTMPEMTGIQLAAALLAIRPDVPVILSTGFSQTATERSAKEAGIRAFVMKPLTKGEIARTVRQVLDGAILLTRS